MLLSLQTTIFPHPMILCSPVFLDAGASGFVHVIKRRPPDRNLFIQTHQSFAQALQSGADLVPTFGFGDQWGRIDQGSRT